MNTSRDWLYAETSAFGGKRLFRLGLAANYGIDEAAVRVAMDLGVNTFLLTMRAGGLISPLKEVLAQKRETTALIAYTSLGWFGWGVRRGAESVLKKLNIDYIDVLLLGWLGIGSSWTPSVQRELLHLKESGKVKSIGVSIHNRKRAGELAVSSPLDLLMIRYNAAHTGAEQDIFPHCCNGKPSILAYTATAWRKLLRAPKGWAGRIMTAGDCYRFQLSHPQVDLALTGPASVAELKDNLKALEKGPLTQEEINWMRTFGKAVHR